MQSDELAILKTVVYADLFDYPLQVDEVARGLFDVCLEAGEVARILDASSRLAAVLERRNDFVFLAGRERLLDRRREGALRAKALRDRYDSVLSMIARLPFVRLVALSGAAAFDNVHDDDVDVFIVTKSGRAWATCFLVTLLTRLLRARRAICANYFLDEGSLALTDRDLYTGHQLVHLKPLTGRTTYQALLEANGWVERQFPNAFAAALATEAPPSRIGIAERVLSVGAGALLEALSRRVLTANLIRKIPPSTDPASVRLGPGRLKLHINDHRPGSISRFERRLAEVVERAERLALFPVAAEGASR